jgi:geranylgeranyl diphosphate synthase type II
MEGPAAKGFRHDPGEARGHATMTPPTPLATQLKSLVNPGRMTAMFDLDAYLKDRRALVERALEQRLPPGSTRPAILHEAMRYSVMAGGKRLRPILCMAACEAVGGTPEAALVPGLALEILHTYTLVHDDLPCMDDDDLRRGRPTAHVVFGEANALLAGDALLTLAFEWLAGVAVPAPASAADLVRELAVAAGSQGVIGGQVEDLAAEGKAPDADRVDYIHRHKTAALIRGAVRMGGLCGGASAAGLQALTRYGDHAGLAFQVADDILNVTSTPEALGKPVGRDADLGKLTYVAVHGLDLARREAESLAREAVDALAALPGNRQPLAALAEYAVRRAT